METQHATQKSRAKHRSHARKSCAALTEGEYWRDAGYRAVKRHGTASQRAEAKQRRMWCKKWANPSLNYLSERAVVKPVVYTAADRWLLGGMRA